MSKERFELAKKIRQRELDKKKKVFERPEGWEDKLKKVPKPQRFTDEDNERIAKEANEAMKERMKEKLKSKHKKSIWQKLIGE